MCAPWQLLTVTGFSIYELFSGTSITFYCDKNRAMCGVGTFDFRRQLLLQQSVDTVSNK